MLPFCLGFTPFLGLESKKRPGVIRLILETDRNASCSLPRHKGDFIPEALLFPKRENDFPVHRRGKLCDTVGLQMHGNISRKQAEP